MSELIKLLDKNSAVEAIRSLAEDDLRFLNNLIIERLKLIYQAKSFHAMAKFSAGDRVGFEDNTGNYISGIVARLNRKSVTIIAIWRSAVERRAETSEARRQGLGRGAEDLMEAITRNPTR